MISVAMRGNRLRMVMAMQISPKMNRSCIIFGNGSKASPIGDNLDLASDHYRILKSSRGHD